MAIDVATGIARILRQEGVVWVATFPVCRVNNALGREGMPMDLSKLILDFHSAHVREPTEFIPALRRALPKASGRPVYIEFVCCQYPVCGQWVGRSTE